MRHVDNMIRPEIIKLVSWLLLLLNPAFKLEHQFRFSYHLKVWIGNDETHDTQYTAKVAIYLLSYFSVSIMQRYSAVHISDSKAGSLFDKKIRDIK